ncbi:hypothetical protein FRB90_006601 [Tulasnella sp. 427]|nr:hypothetical protein FRB90_006601 [Tulasnella sp. 427]
MSTHASRSAQSARATTPVNRSTGHHSSSKTPRLYGPVSTPATEVADEVDAKVEVALYDKLYSIPADVFIKLPWHLDATKATARRVPVLEEMARQESVDKDEIEPFLPKHNSKSFSELRGRFSQEKAVYTPLVTLLTYINTFFRVNLEFAADNSSIDSPWPRAVNPLATTSKSTPVELSQHDHLRRSFVITEKKRASFRHVRSSSVLLPDLCLLLEPAIPPPSDKLTPPPKPSIDSTTAGSGAALEPASGQRMTRPKSKSRLDHAITTATKPKEPGSSTDRKRARSKKALKPAIAPVAPPIEKRFGKGGSASTKPKTLYWKDVKVPIEVKLKSSFTSDDMWQTARYVRGVKLEQFDRNVVFSLMLNQEDCRVFYWDAAVCLVSKINIHKDPTQFIQVIGRLASMSPESLGYDLNFLDAGRVLASETLRTILTVVPTPATEFIGTNQPVPEDQEKVLRLELDVNNPLSEPRGFLFSRFARVWKALEVGESKRESWPTRVVKQNWADVARIFEGFLGVHEEPSRWSQRSHPGGLRMSSGSTSGNEPDNTQSDSNTNNTSDQSDDSDTHQSDDSDSHSVGEDSNTFTLDPNPSPKERKKSFKLEKGSKALALNVVDRAVVRIRTTQTPPEPTPPETYEKGKDDSRSAQDFPQDPEPNATETIADRAKTLQDSTRYKDAHQCGDNQAQDRKPKDHHHLTGTLPFIPYEVLRANKRGKPVTSTYHHDIESIFCVLVYICLRNSGDTYSRDQRILLDSSSISSVLSCKSELLSNQMQDIEFADEFQSLKQFFCEFSMCFSYGQKVFQPVKFEGVFDIIDRALQRLEQESSSNEPSQPRKTALEEVVSALEVPSLEEQDDKASSASEQLSTQSSKRKLSDLKGVESQTTTGAQPQEEDDVREGSSRPTLDLFRHVHCETGNRKISTVKPVKKHTGTLYKNSSATVTPEVSLNGTSMDAYDPVPPATSITSYDDAYFGPELKRVLQREQQSRAREMMQRVMQQHRAQDGVLPADVDDADLADPKMQRMLLQRIAVAQGGGDVPEAGPALQRAGMPGGYEDDDVEDEQDEGAGRAGEGGGYLQTLWDGIWGRAPVE